MAPMLDLEDADWGIDDEDPEPEDPGKPLLLVDEEGDVV